MAIGAVGVIGRLGAKAAVGTVKLGGKAAVATGKAAINTAKATPGATGRAAVNVPTNLAKMFWNAQVQDLGLSSLSIRSGPLLKPKANAELDENGKPKVKRKRKTKPDKPTVEPRDSGTVRGAAQIVAALKPLSSIEAALDGMDGSLAGMREDIQGLSRVNSQGFANVINTLKTLLPNAFDNLRNQRAKHSEGGSGGSGGKERKGILDSLSGLPSFLNSIFGKAGLIATAIGAIAKLGRGIGRGAGSVARGVARAGRGIANAGRETIRGRSNSARATARAIGAGEAIPEVVRPVEAPRATETIRANEAPRANATETARPVEAPRAAEPVKPAVDVNRPLNDAPRPTDRVAPPEAKPVEPPTAKPLVPDADGKIHDPNRINFGEPDGRVVPPTPTVEPPKPSVAEVIKATEVPAINAADATPELKPTETVKPIEPEAPKPTLKPDAEVKATEAKPKSGIRGSGALSKALGRAFIGGALVLEGIEGYDSWSDAYDKYLAGEITPKEYRKKTIEIVGKAAGSFSGGLALGGIAGGIAGAAVGGPAAPITATIAGLGGGLVGGIAGSVAGGYVGSGVGGLVADKLIGPIDDEDKKLPQRPNGTTPVTPALPTAPTVGVPTASTIAPQAATQAASPVATVQASTPTVTAATQMIANSNQVAAQNRVPAPPIVIAPQTNNTTNNSVGGGSGSGRPAVGNPRPDMSPLDQANLGARIGNVPGQNF